MYGSKIDRFARFLAVGTSRRSVVKSISGGALAGAAVIGGVSRVSAASERSAAGDQSVLMLELMALTLSEEYGNCDSVADAFDRFREQNLDLMSELEAETLTWTPEQRIEHRDAYADRISQATAVLQSVATRCGFQPDSTSRISEADMAEPTAGATTTGVKSLMAQGTGSCHDCNLQCVCVDHPPTADECWGSAFACIGGSNGACCWLGICIDFSVDFCKSQATNCCNL
jgi:hypothetical protein